MDFAAYHDAVLEKITFDWSAKSIEFALTLVGSRRVTLRWIGFREINLTRLDAWDPSNSVNQIRHVGAGPERGRIAKR